MFTEKGRLETLEECLRIAQQHNAKAVIREIERLIFEELEKKLVK